MIAIPTQLTPVQARFVYDALATDYPALGVTLQVVNAGGQFRIKAVRGGVMPKCLTAEKVQALINQARIVAPKEASQPETWYAEAVHP